MNSATLDYISSNKHKTAAEIAAELTADLTLSRRIDRKALGAHLLLTGLDERFEATKAHAACPNELQVGLRRLERFLTWGLDYAGTDETSVGSEVSLLVLGLQAFQGALNDATVGLSEAEGNLILALGGGYRYEKPTEAEIQTALDQINADNAQQALRQRIATAYSAAIDIVDQSEALPDWDDVCTIFNATE